MKLTDNAIKVLEKRYLAKDEQGNIVETPEQMFRRVAHHVAQADSIYDPKVDVSKTEQEFYDIMTELEFLPNSPTLMNAGRPLGQLSACFVLPIEDSMEGIFDSVKNAALIHKSGGGCISSDANVYTTFCGVEEISTLYDKIRVLGIEEKEGNNYKVMDVSELGIRTFAMDPATGRFAPKQITHIWQWDVPEENQCTVYCSDGTQVTTSSWHPFIVFTKDGAVERRADEIKTGDILFAPNCTTMDSWPFKEYKEIDGIKLDEHMAWLTGYFLGDGSLGWFLNKKNNYKALRLRFFDGRAESINFAANILAEHGVFVKPQQDRRGLWMLTTTDQYFVSEFAKIAYAEPGLKRNLVLPDWVMKSPLSVIGAFLGGLIDSDGYVSLKRRRIEFYTICQKLAKQLVSLLSALGFNPSIAEKQPLGKSRTLGYDLHMADAKKTPLLVELVDNWVHDSLKSYRLIQLKERIVANTHRRIPIPFEALEPLLSAAGVETHSTAIHREAIRVGDESFWLHQSKWGIGIGEDKLHRLVEALRSVLPQKYHDKLNQLNNLASGWTVVDHVEQAAYPQKFYDFTVDDFNNYIAGGKLGKLTVIHNTGFSFSRLRPKGATVRSTGGVASGPVSFMKVFNAATEAVKQGGTRRGANMGILRVDHPDILEFIQCKKDNSDITNFNISVGITEKFMEAVEKDEEYDLIDPHTGKITQRLRARQVFDLIVDMAWHNGEPGIVFLDRINKDNVVPALGEIESTNPCITGDTWVLTENGPEQVVNILGKQISLALNGDFYSSSEIGFFKTGNKSTISIRTDKGYKIEVTPDHKIRIAVSITRDNIQEEWKPAGELKPGDHIVLSDNRGLVWEGRGSFEDGYLLGLLLGDGTLKNDGGIISVWGDDYEADSIIKAAEEAAFTLPHRGDFNGFKSMIGERKEHRMQMSALWDLAAVYKIFPGDKRITEELEKTSYDFHRGFLRGIFDADGTVTGNQEKGVSIRLWQNDIEGLRIIQRMLLRLGIVSTLHIDRKAEEIKQMPDGKGGTKEYHIRSGHELVITSGNLAIFFEQVGFSDAKKHDLLEQRLTDYRRAINRERLIATVDEVVQTGERDVYDVQIPGVNAFDANGICVHNCGEQPLLPYESCNLGSINLLSVVQPVEGGKWEINYAKLARIVDTAVHFLDNVIDVNLYPLPEIEKMTKGTRKIGLGVMGWADMLFRLGIPYNSDEAIELGTKLMKFICDRARQQSAELAGQRGTFPAYEQSIWKDKGLEVRNATVTTIAPTGSISIIAGVSSGIEPLFAISFVRNVMDNTQLPEVHPIFEEVAKQRGFYSAELMRQIAHQGSIQHMDGIPDDVKRVFVTAHDISPEYHVRMQAAFQRYTDNAVSKTVNFPNSATQEDVRQVYILAYKLGCKGVTIYRDGSRETQVLNIGDKDKIGADVMTQPEPTIIPRPRPEITRGITEKVRIGCGNLYITVNYDDQGICEVFTNLGKAGGCPSQSEATSRLVSLALRSGIDVKALVDQLKGIRCHTTIRQRGLKVLSCPDAIARTIEKVMKIQSDEQQNHFGIADDIDEQNDKEGRAVCPECGGELEHESGCVMCPSCGYSKCG